MFEELVKEKFHKIIELPDEKSPHNLKCYFKDNTATKGGDDFADGINFFNKIKSGEIKLEEAKNLSNLQKSYLNEISKRNSKSKEQITALSIN